MKILFVHKRLAVAETLRQIFIQTLAYPERMIITTNSPLIAMNLLEKEDIGLVVTGADFPNFEYAEVISQFNKSSNREAFVLIVYSGGGRVISSTLAGADDFIPMPELDNKVLVKNFALAIREKEAYHKNRGQRFGKLAASVEKSI